MNDLLERSRNLRESADRLLEKSGLLEILNEYGEVVIGGSYLADIMVYGDIDITVVREENFSFDDSLAILKKIYDRTHFSSFFVGGDWSNPWNEDQNMEGELKSSGGAGKYIGLKDRHDQEEWKVDLWFISKEEAMRRRSGFFRDYISEMEMTEEQKILILELKHYVHKREYDISSNFIYDLVLNKGCSNFREGIKLLNDSTATDKIIV